MRHIFTAIVAWGVLSIFAQVARAEDNCPQLLLDAVQASNVPYNGSTSLEGVWCGPFGGGNIGAINIKMITQDKATIIYASIRNGSIGTPHTLNVKLSNPTTVTFVNTWGLHFHFELKDGLLWFYSADTLYSKLTRVKSPQQTSIDQ